MKYRKTDEPRHYVPKSISRRSRILPPKSDVDIYITPNGAVTMWYKQLLSGEPYDGPDEVILITGGYLLFVIRRRRSHNSDSDYLGHSMAIQGYFGRLAPRPGVSDFESKGIGA